MAGSRRGWVGDEILTTWVAARAWACQPSGDPRPFLQGIEELWGSESDAAGLAAVEDRIKAGPVRST